MIDKKLILDTVEAFTAEKPGVFPVDVTVDADNNIVVELDSTGVLDIDTCAELTRRLNEVLDRDAEDYSLEVGSAGLTSPLKVYGQWVKNLGNELEILTADGRKLRGRLAEVSPEDEPLKVTLETTVKVREPGAKRPVMKTEPVTLSGADIRRAVYHIDFK